MAVLGAAFLLASCVRSAGPRAGVTVEGAWARPGEKGGTSAVYFTVRNTGREGDHLLGANTDVAGEASLHETVAEGSAAAPGLVLVSQGGTGGGADGAVMEHDHRDGGAAGTAAAAGEAGDADAGMQEPMPHGGMMRMQPVEAVSVPAGGTVEFKPGGLHVMLMDLRRDLKPGDTFSLTLRFEKAGALGVEVTVRQP